MGAVSRRLFKDDDLGDMYCPNNGRPSLPPSMMSGATVLQFYDDVSDGEVVERTQCDLCLTDYPPRRLKVGLIENGQERYAFDRFVKVGREAGFIPDKVTLLMDTTWFKRGSAVQDTYTLIRKGVRNLLRALG